MSGTSLWLLAGAFMAGLYLYGLYLTRKRFWISTVCPLVAPGAGSGRMHTIHQ